jgi:hypothetical protein
MKTYYGRRDPEAGCVVTYRRAGADVVTPLPVRSDLYDDSPTSFDWGHNGAGPAQLALALLADHLGDDQRALRLHQDFKRHVVSALRDEWALTSDKIERAIADIEDPE